MTQERAIRQGAPTSWGFGRVLALVAIVGAVALLVWVVVVARDVVLLAMLAVLFAVLLDGGVRGLRALVDGPRWSALLLMFLLLLAVLLGGTLMLAPRVSADLGKLAERIPDALEQIDHGVRGTSWGQRAVNELDALMQPGNLAERAGHFLGFFSSVMGVFTGALVVIVLGVFMAIEPNTYVEGGLRLLPPGARGRGVDIAYELGRSLRWWLLGRLLSMVIVFAFTWIGLLLLGVPLAFLLALIAGLFSFVPTFGPLASAVPAILVGLSSGLEQALWVALLYFGVQMVESWGITPFIQRRAVRLPPALLVVFQLVMGVLAGVLGVLLATPILVVIMVLAGMLYVEGSLGEEVDLP
jgi:predicted PurR-regulated permease PerM